MRQSTFAEQLLFTTVRVETTRSDGKPYVGTAFDTMLLAMTGGRLSVPGLPLPYAYASALP